MNKKSRPHGPNFIRNLVLILAIFSVILHLLNFGWQLWLLSIPPRFINILPHLSAILLIVLIALYIVYKINDVSKQLYSLTITDELTKLNNSRKFDQDWEYLLEHYKRYNEIFCLAFIDINNFKNYNDHFGHQAGDILLREFGKLLVENVRKTDICYRYGGDEFIIIFSKTRINKIKTVADRIIKEFKGRGFKNVGLSMGVSQIKEEDTKEMIIKRADNLMYIAKNKGGGYLLES
ncbi:MAG: GGDEF domain-containing protein [bacterium]|nr:GGDEF domain-containing protein [bacterium]